MFVPIDTSTIKYDDKLLRRLVSRKTLCATRTNNFRQRAEALLRVLRLSPDHSDRYNGRAAVIQSEFGGMGDFTDTDNISELDDADLVKGNNKRVDGLNIPMLNTQINECVSELSSLLLNYSDAFAAYGSPAYQSHIEAFSNRMSEDFKHYNHYVQFVKAFKYLLYYNRVVVHQSWKNGDDFNGVEVITHNPANAFISLPDEEGQVDFAMLVTRVLKEAMVSQYVSLTDNKGEILFDQTNPFAFTYVPSNIEHFGGRVDNEMDNSEYYCNKFVTYIKARPITLFEDKDIPEGLVKLNNYLWRITYVNNKLAAIEVSENLMMPVIDISMVDGMSNAEQLLPIQRYINFLGGMKKAADRKRVFGINFYDREVVHLDDIETAKAKDAVSPYIATSPGEGKSLQQSILHFNDAPDTQHVITDILSLKSLMQTVLPTDFATRMGSLDRATEYQAKRAMEQSTKLSRLFAILINQLLISPLKRIHINLLFDNLSEIEMVNDRGEIEQKPIEEFLGKNIVGSITTAITGIDRDIKAEQLDVFLNKLVQMPQVAAEYDLTKLLDYQSSLTGHKIDFSMFKRESPIDNLPIQQRDMAYQLLQQAMQAQQNGQPSGGGDASGIETE